MSEIGNSLKLITNFDNVEEVTGFFSASKIDDERFSFDGDCGREFGGSHRLSPVSYGTALGPLQPNATISFDTFPKATHVDEHLVANEVAVVVSCIMSHDRIPRGAYFYNDVCLALWDWDGDGLAVSSDHLVWSRPEARVLRHRLHGAGIRYDVKQVELAIEWDAWLRARDQKGHWDDLGTLPEPEGWTIFG